MVSGDPSKGMSEEIFYRILIVANTDYIELDGIWESPSERDHPVEKKIFNKTKPDYQAKYLGGTSRYFASINNEDFIFMNDAKHGTLLRSNLTKKKIQVIEGFSITEFF